MPHGIKYGGQVVGTMQTQHGPSELDGVDKGTLQPESQVSRLVKSFLSTSLDLSDRILVTVPPELQLHCLALTSLIVSHNALTTLKYVPQTLTHLDASNNLIADVSTVSVLTRLRTLNLDHNMLPSLKGIDGCSQLQQLVARSNTINDLAAVKCPALARLDVMGNNIATIATLRHLGRQNPCLTWLNVRNNPIAQREDLRDRVCSFVPHLVVFNSMLQCPFPVPDSELNRLKSDETAALLVEPRVLSRPPPLQLCTVPACVRLRQRREKLGQKVASRNGQILHSPEHTNIVPRHWCVQAATNGLGECACASDYTGSVEAAWNDDQSSHIEIDMVEHTDVRDKRYSRQGGIVDLDVNTVSARSATPHAADTGVPVHHMDKRAHHRMARRARAQGRRSYVLKDDRADWSKSDSTNSAQNFQGGRERYHIPKSAKAQHLGEVVFSAERRVCRWATARYNVNNERLGQLHGSDGVTLNRDQRRRWIRGVTMGGSCIGDDDDGAWSDHHQHVVEIDDRIVAANRAFFVSSPGREVKSWDTMKEHCTGVDIDTLLDINYSDTELAHHDDGNISGSWDLDIDAHQDVGHRMLRAVGSDTHGDGVVDWQSDDDTMIPQVRQESADGDDATAFEFLFIRRRASDDVGDESYVHAAHYEHCTDTLLDITDDSIGDADNY